MRSTLMGVFLLVLVSSGCLCGGNGPCYSAGVLFKDPAVRVVPPVADAGFTLSVTWTPDPSVPASFYEQTPSVVTSTFPAPRDVDAGVGEALVSFDRASRSPLDFELQYEEPSPRSCAHGGMADTYVMSVTATWASDGGLADAGVTTRVRLGAY